MHRLLALIFLLAFSITVTSLSEPQVPTTFGLLTISHQRDSNNTQFKTYLERFAKMNCSVISEINVVWNSNKSMEEQGVLNTKAEWTKPVNFYKTPNNSMIWKFMIPKQSKAQVYFTIDEDIDISCQQLIKGFQLWRSFAIGNLAPILSYNPRLYEHYGGQMRYTKAESPFYTMGLVGLAFISRHFAELFYADVLEFNQMRKIIESKSNCDDIGLNWIVQYYYPELPTKSVFGLFRKVNQFKQWETKSQNYASPINYCMKQFTKIFGVNTLRYMPLNQTIQGYEQRIMPLRRESVLIKQKYIDQFILKKQKNNSKSFDANELLQQYTKLYNDRPDYSYIKMNQVMIYESDESRKGIFINKTTEQIQKETESMIKMIEKAQRELQFRSFQNERVELKWMKIKTYFHSYFILFLSVLIIGLIWKIVQQKRKNRLNSKQQGPVQLIPLTENKK